MRLSLCFQDEAVAVPSLPEFIGCIELTLLGLLGSPGSLITNPVWGLAEATVQDVTGLSTLLGFSRMHGT
jgi:hypothetical protein